MQRRSHLGVAFLPLQLVKMPMCEDCGKIAELREIAEISEKNKLARGVEMWFIWCGGYNSARLPLFRKMEVISVEVVRVMAASIRNI